MGMTIGELKKECSYCCREIDASGLESFRCKNETVIKTTGSSWCYYKNANEPCSKCDYCKPKEEIGMTIDDFYEFYKAQLCGKYYCTYQEVEDEYHYERENKGYDHLGSLGYKDVKVIDSYKTVVSREKINKHNVIDIARKLLNKKGWLEDDRN